MAHAIGMLLGAFVLLYGLYVWLYGRGDEQTGWYEILLFLRYDSYIHSKASFRRVLNTWKMNWVPVVAGMVAGWGMTESILAMLN